MTSSNSTRIYILDSNNFSADEFLSNLKEEEIAPENTTIIFLPMSDNSDDRRGCKTIQGKHPGSTHSKRFR